MSQPAGNRLQVLVIDPNLTEHRAQLAEALSDIADVAWVNDPTSAEAAELLGQADIYVGSKLSPEMIAKAGGLQFVQSSGAGYDGIALDALPDGIQVANTFNHEASIAEYVLAVTVMMRRGLLAQHHELGAGRWASSVYDASMPQAHSLADAKIGILGYGHIGQAVWNGFRAFGASGRAIKNSPAGHTPDGLDWIGTVADLDRLLDESDVLVICMPLNDATRGIIAAPQLERLGANGIVVNVGRGPLVDEDAFYTALEQRTIAGAAIDVWYQYPDASGQALPATRPFWELPNVLLTPHISGVTSATFAARAGDIADNIRRHATGQPIQRVVHGAAAN